MNTTISACLALASISFATVPNTFSSGKSVVAREVNENFTYLDTTMAKKADANSVTSLQSSLNAKADQSLLTSLQTSKSDTADMRKVRDTLRTKVDQASLANALNPFAKKTYVDSATKATLASAIQANTASIPNIPGSQILGQINPDNLRNFESGISGADGPNKPWDWAVYQTLAPYAGGSIQLAGRHCAGCGSSYALRTKDDNNASSIWSPWYSLWHSGNLTANTLPGGPYLPTSGGSISGWVGLSGNAGVSLSVSSTDPYGATLQQFVTGAGVNANKWDNYVAYNQLQYRLVSDDYKNASAWMVVTRSGTTLDSIALGGKTFVNGGLTVTGALKANGSILASQIEATDLKIAGSITASPTIPVADYVFEPDYKLTSLSEVEAYTKEHKHLPEVPSATEIGKSGLDLAQMNLVLLKKVEELTLHAIAQQKEIAELRAIVESR
jgi:hypothetical protein